MPSVDRLPPNTAADFQVLNKFFSWLYMTGMTPFTAVCFQIPPFFFASPESGGIYWEGGDGCTLN